MRRIEMTDKKLEEIGGMAVEKATGMWTAFKKFAFKGNVVDLAVGVIIGAAFGKIVTSLVNDIVTPLISLLTGRVNLTQLKWVLREAVTAADGTVETAEAAIAYGNFLQVVIDFFLVALSIFLMVKALTFRREKAEAAAAVKKKAEEAAKAAEEAAKPKPKTETELLEEILAEMRARH